MIYNTYVNGIIGKLGRGKTLSAVALAWISKYKFNTKIITNMASLTFKDYFIMDITELPELKEKIDLDNRYLFIIDELSVLLDSRRGMVKKNVEKTHELLQLRKLNVSFLYTVQNAGMIDIRIREITDNYYTPYLYQQYDYLLLEKVNIRNLGMVYHTNIFSKALYHISKYYKYYDTHETFYKSET